MTFRAGSLPRSNFETTFQVEIENKPPTVAQNIHFECDARAQKRYELVFIYFTYKLSKMIVVMFFVQINNYLFDRKILCLKLLNNIHMISICI